MPLARRGIASSSLEALYVLYLPGSRNPASKCLPEYDSGTLFSSAFPFHQAGSTSKDLLH
jgi:hypothetical protein